MSAAMESNRFRMKIRVLKLLPADGIKNVEKKERTSALRGL
jgi:hypothetical protein